MNLYGPGDNFDPASSHVIPALILKTWQAMQQGESEIVLWGDGSPTREFLYVTDAAEGICLAAERLDQPIPVNLGTGTEISIRDLAGRITEVMAFRGSIRWDTSQPNGLPRRRLDVTRAKELLGFEARVGFEEGLQNTVGWFLDNASEVVSSFSVPAR